VGCTRCHRNVGGVNKAHEAMLWPTCMFHTTIRSRREATILPPPAFDEIMETYESERILGTYTYQQSR